MGSLITEPNLAAPDDFYERLIAVHRDLTRSKACGSTRSSILLLANHIGDLDVVMQALAAAREGITADSAHSAG